jgi:hypothetical protein
VIEHRILCFLGRHSTTRAMPPDLFVLAIFDIGSVYAWSSLIHDPPICASQCTYHCAQLLVEMESCDPVLAGLEPGSHHLQPPE